MVFQMAGCGLLNASNQIRMQLLSVPVAVQIIRPKYFILARHFLCPLKWF